MTHNLQVYCPPLLPRAVYVIQPQEWPNAARCWLVPVTAAGGTVDWSRRREVPMPHPARLGPEAFSRGPLVASLSAAFEEGGAAE